MGKRIKRVIKAVAKALKPKKRKAGKTVSPPTANKIAKRAKEIKAAAKRKRRARTKLPKV